MWDTILSAVTLGYLAASPPGGCKPTAPRSPQWAAVRKAHLKAHPACAACGGTHDLDVHHELPFHLFPQMELEPSNLITLCTPHHLLCGHLMLWQSYNPEVRADAAAWLCKIKARP